MIHNFFIWLDWDIGSIVGMCGLIVAFLCMAYLVIFHKVGTFWGFPWERYDD